MRFVFFWAEEWESHAGLQVMMRLEWTDSGRLELEPYIIFSGMFHSLPLPYCEVFN